MYRLIGIASRATLPTSLSTMLSSFTCQTCSESLDDLCKHLSLTRHRAVTYNPLDESIKCQQCGDTNIHLLRMLRYGLSELALLCTECATKKDAEPLAEYSLSNGSLFLKLPQYYEFRDIECERCHATTNLAVATTKTDQHVICKQCRKDYAPEVQRMKFVSQDDDEFLYALLGIKEHVPKPEKLKGRQGRSTRVRKPRKEDPNAEQRRAHYENKKATEAALKGKTIKAVGSGGPSPAISRSGTPAPSGGAKSGFKSGTVRSGDSNGGSKSSSSREPKSVNSKSGASKSGNSKPGNSKSGSPTTPNVPTSKPKGTDRGKPKGDAKTENSKSTESKSGKSNQENLKQEGKLKQERNQTAPTGKPKGGAKSDEKEKPQARANEENASKQSTDKVISQKGLSPQITLPPGIFKYEPAKNPKLTYDSMDEYFNEMCYNLFLEEKASMFASNNSMLTADEFNLEWYADQDKKHKQFKVSMMLTPEILDRYMSRKMQNLKRAPFSVGQALMLVLGDDIPWYGRIVLSETKILFEKPSKFQRGRRPPRKDGPKRLDLIVELYKWNKQPLPLSVNVGLLQILPVSVPVSRVFIAMSRILNPKFIDMILGKKPIRQIFFKNYLNFTKDTFNESQKVAVQSVLNNSITVMQGPPGTGKTSTIYEIILQLLDNLNTFPILVVAASNIAIDNIAEKLVPKHRQSILRIVSLEKESEYTREHPLASICLHHKVFDGLPLQCQELIREMRRPGSSISQSQYKKLLTAQIDYSDTLIALARVIFTTTVVAGGNQLKPVPKMPVVIMDEATQSSEPTTLIPLSMPGVEKFVFVGDQNQLSSFSQVPNLSLSLFERIISNGTYKTPHMLDTQYRMHPAISEFPRNKFYGGLLKDGISADDRKKDGIPPNPVVFWDTCGKSPESHVRSRFREDSGLTYANVGEISYVEKVLTNLIFEKGVPKSEIGVITPYRGQRDKISSALVENELINPEKDEVHVEIDRDDFFNESKPITIHTVSDIMIASIDAFQGREKDFLVMSCVRSNANGKIGFLNDARRMNVALTRARYGLILIGDVECLKSDKLWNEYLTSLLDKKLILRSDAFAYT